MAEKAAPKTKKPKAPVKKTKTTKGSTIKTVTKKPVVKKTVAKKAAPAKAAASKTSAKKSVSQKPKSPPKAPPKAAPKSDQSQQANYKSESSHSDEQRSSKSTDWTKDIFDKFKKGLDEAYDAGMKLADKVGETAQEYTEKYKLQMEIRRSKSKRKEHIIEIGEKVYEMYPNLGQATNVAKDKNIANLYAEILALELRIKEMNDQLKTLDDEK